MKHIVQFSGGKDSTAMLNLMIEKGMQIDEVVFFDTGWEFDSVYENIQIHKEKLERLGIPFTKLDRASCYCCGNKNLKELRNVYNCLPAYWNKLKEKQSMTDRLYKKIGIAALEHRFENEIL